MIIIIIFKIGPIEPSSEPPWCRQTRPNCCQEYTKETCTEYCDSNPCNGRGSNQRLLHMSTPYSPM